MNLLPSAEDSSSVSDARNDHKNENSRRRGARATALVALLGCGMAASAQAEMASYAIEPTHTSVLFEILHNNTSTLRGRFDKKEGSVEFDRAGKAGRADITVDIASLDTGLAAFTKNLLDKNFLNLAAAPTARFVGDKFVFDGDKVKEVSGQMTILGKSVPVTLRAVHFNCYTSPLIKREICGGDFETTIQRSDFGMTYKLPDIPDSVHLLIQVEAIKQTP
jgi:polyisoprenoid-binding protein YceI